MAHIDLDHADMKPSALVRYEILRDHTRAKQLFVVSAIAAMMIVVLAGMFLSLMR